MKIYIETGLDRSVAGTPRRTLSVFFPSITMSMLIMEQFNNLVSDPNNTVERAEGKPRPESADPRHHMLTISYSENDVPVITSVLGVIFNYVL